MARILAVIAPENFQPLEYAIPKQVLESAGHQVITTSTTEEAIDNKGNTQKVDILLSDVNYQDYDAVYFVGGSGAHFYFDHDLALSLAKNFYKSGRLTCAICAAPSILANAGLLENKTATSFPSHEENLRAKGANFTGNPVEQDEMLITANGPDAAEAFGKQIVKALENR